VSLNKISSLLTFLFIVGLKGIQSYGQLPDSTTQVSLITVGPGEDLYSSFGHSLFWFEDPGKGLDASYNYGSFDFDTENFYIKFLSGTLPYKLEKIPLAPQFNYWVRKNRSVTQQVLQLTTAQKQKLYSLLEENYKPEKRTYHYRFFYDNCATRLQDMLLAACGSEIKYDGYTHETLSFREWIDRYAHQQKPWADFGMDLAIGKPADKLATPMQATFLPDNLQAAFADAKITIDGKDQPLVAATYELYTATPRPPQGMFTPQTVFWILAVLTALFTWWQMRQNKISFTYDKILFNLTAIAGTILLLLWFGTNHEDTKWNWDVLWASPLLFLIAKDLSPRRKNTRISILLILYTILLLLGTVNLDKHNQVLIPILLTLVIRIYYINTRLPKIPKS